ncbi:MAG: sulfotransferase domain-containing protein [Bacteroidota bacterium]
MAVPSSIPNAIFISGVRKCGSTSLFSVLAKHSELSTAKIKEPMFFCLAADEVQRSFSTYVELYDLNKRILDGSAIYAQFDHSFTNIEQFCDQAKHLICLRDPAKRFFSAYWHMKVKVPQVEKRSLQEVIDSITGNTQADILERETTSLKEAVQKKKIDADYLGQDYHRRYIKLPFETRGVDPMTYYAYYRESCYSLRMPAIEKNGNYLLVFFEQLIKDEARVIDEVHQFLELELEDKTTGLGLNTNKTMSAKRDWLDKLLRKVYVFINNDKGFKVGDRLKYWVKQRFYNAAPKISESEYNSLRILLQEEYDFWFERYPELKTLWKF